MDASSITGAHPSTYRGAQPVVLGVCAAVSERTGVSLPLVRAAVITLAAAGGAGLVGYLLVAVLWRDREGVRRPPATESDVGLVIVLIGTVWITLALWPGAVAGLVIPVGFVSVGVALGWRSAGRTSDESRSPQSDRSTFGAKALRSAVLRIIGGLVLCFTGFAFVLGRSTDLSTFRDTLFALVVALTGIGLVLGPTVVAAARALTAERDDRVRAEERAKVAAHLHDSVLQTLTLIQKRADDPAAMASLARQEERSLRSWLYSGADPYTVEPGSITGDDRLGSDRPWREQIEPVVSEVERRYSVAIELVMVGPRDHPRPSMLAPVIAAAREAMVNAAKFSGQRNVSVFVEVRQGGMDLYVRDRGIGFDPGSIASDRHGIKDSIIGRMVDLGGRATIRSAPGEGTEVGLLVPFSNRVEGHGVDRHSTYGNIVDEEANGSRTGRVTDRSPGALGGR